MGEKKEICDELSNDRPLGGELASQVNPSSQKQANSHFEEIDHVLEALQQCSPEMLAEMREHLHKQISAKRKSAQAAKGIEDTKAARNQLGLFYSAFSALSSPT